MQGNFFDIGVNLTHPRFQSLLDNADIEAEDLSYGQLQVIDKKPSS